MADNTVAGGLLSFQDFPASQDHYYEFNDFSQVIKPTFAPVASASCRACRACKLPALLLPA